MGTTWEDTRGITCCFTGHRPNKLPWGYQETDPRCMALKEKLKDVVEALYDVGIRRFICGMAQGCDFFFCEAVLHLREEKADVVVEAAVPCEGQSDAWPPEVQERYNRLLEACDVRTLVSRSYTPDCMQKRNQYMVDKASVLVAVYDGTQGGTMQTVLYAMRQGVEIIEIQP